MPGTPAPGVNTFQETLLGMEFSESEGRPADLFSRACVDQFDSWDLGVFGYRLAQVFEPNVLFEVALISGVPYTDLADLTHRPSATINRLGNLADRSGELSPVELVNVASALISISRFDLAEQMLDRARARTSTARERFEISMLDFVISNRRDDGAGSPAAFHAIRQAIESKELPADRILYACSQAVVWYLKRKEMQDVDFDWYVTSGRDLAKSDDVDPASVSSWYRALAMLPAAQGNRAATREYMVEAKRTAEEAMERRPGAYESHFLKTYFESALKEYMYVTPDREKAIEVGTALVALDPVWSPSHGEVAEAHARFGEFAQAAENYDRAAELGPPYYGHHLLQSARHHEKSGQIETAVARYRTLADLVPADRRVLEAGLSAARSIGDDTEEFFAHAVSALGPELTETG